MEKKKILANQQGFTLIEIIAVLVLLGILAAVALPKYMSMQEQAELKSVAGVKAELQSRANQYHGQYLLNQTAANKTLAEQAETAWDDEAIGADFTLDGTTDGKIVVTVAGTGKKYDIAFTDGTVNTTAIFGAITPQ